MTAELMTSRGGEVRSNDNGEEEIALTMKGMGYLYILAVSCQISMKSALR
jgi:hypothetical protein